MLGENIERHRLCRFISLCSALLCSARLGSARLGATLDKSRPDKTRLDYARPRVVFHEPALTGGTLRILVPLLLRPQIFKEGVSHKSA